MIKALENHTNPFFKLQKSEPISHSRPHNLKEAAQGFEALFISELLKVMRKSIGKSNLLGEGLSGEIYTSMFDESLARVIASNGGLGLADIIVRNLERKHQTELPEGPFKLQNYRKISSFNFNWDRKLIDNIAQKFDIDPKLVKALIKVESNFNAHALSKKGAAGLMQLMPETAQAMGIKNRFDPAQNIYGGVKYLKSLLQKFNGNLELALSAYNAGPSTVEQYGGIPPFPETQNYVKKVLKFYKESS
ncbi:MAG: lytic transglycosylase domain-containing protein [Calditrichaeota bacterium]|nr:MAG: lytic transglycosylase domain-containing protein [Calditrichota bacterium]